MCNVNRLISLREAGRAEIEEALGAVAALGLDSPPRVLMRVRSIWLARCGRSTVRRRREPVVHNRLLAGAADDFAVDAPTPGIIAGVMRLCAKDDVW